MEQLFINDFEKREWIGRQALRQLASKHPDTFKWSINYTDYQYEYFDASFIIYDYETQVVKKRVFIEIKCRDTAYVNYVLEKKKVSNMRKKMKELFLEEGDYTLLYLNFTPRGTHMWDITNIKPEDCKDKMFMNKRTSESRSDKVSKYCMLLEPKTSKTFSYIIDQEDILNKEYMKQYVVPLVEEKVKRRGFGFLFDE